MAARSRVDSGVNERRLRPVYDCLDNGNNKKALQEAEKVLRKQKDFQCAKVLKALALLRLGRNEDSTKLLKEVQDEVPTDDATLQAITICYRELQKLDSIAEVYEAAMRKDPTNEELLTHLFMAYVRIGEYKKQQQVAMSLYKLKSKNPYYFWAVMSIVMQAHDASEDMARKMFLPLAERMTEKFARENRIEAEAEVHLYLLILELELKYEEALEVLRGPLGEKLTSFLDFKQVKCAELLLKLQKWSEVVAAYKDLIVSNPDNWSFHCEYLSATFKIADESGLNDENSKVNDAIEAARNFIVSLVETQNANEGRALRGPYLARMKLCCMCKENKYDLRDPLVDLLNDYFVRFGDKPCCYNDINLFLDRVDDREKLCFLAAASEVVGLNLDRDEIDYPTDIKQMQRHLCYVQLCHRLDVHNKLDVTDRHRLVSELLQRYRHASKFGADLLLTDIQPNDGYCLLASHVLFDIWKETGDSRCFNELLVMLEAALVNSPSSHQIKLLLLKLYGGIGAVGPCYSLYDSMDIKHILQDALGYLVAPVLLGKGHFTQGSLLYSNMLKFFNSNYKDTVDYLIASYKFGSFLKIREFVNFRERLRNSLQFATASVERSILDLIMETDNHESTEAAIARLQIDPEVEAVKTENLRDNRDMSIMVSWASPDKQVSAATKQQSMEAEVVWWQIRNVLVQAVVAAAGTISRRESSNEKTTETDNCLASNGIKRLPLDTLGDLVKKLAEVVEAQKVESYLLPEAIVQCPFQSRLVLNLKGRYTVPIINLLKDFLALSQFHDHGDSSEIEIVGQTLFQKESRDEIKECIVRVTNNVKGTDGLRNLAFMGHILEEMVNVSEMVSFLVVILGFCRRILESFKGIAGKKGKKRKEAPPQQSSMPKVVDRYNTFLDELQIVTTELYDVLQEVRLESLLSQLKVTVDRSAFPQHECDVSAKVDKSYRQSLVGIGDLLKNKLKYMTSLRLC